MLMAVILTDTGTIKETIIKFDQDISEEQVDTLNFIFNNKLRGKPLDFIDKPLEEYIFFSYELQFGCYKTNYGTIDQSYK